MARIVFPVRFIDWTTLFKTLKAKHVADGAASPLTPFLTQEGINLTTDETAANNAVTVHASFAQAEKDAEKQSAERNRLFDPVFKDHRDAVQFLKKLFKSNVHQVGDWGVTVDGEGRIAYPPDFANRQQTVIAFLDKHDSFAAGTSPLEPFLTANGIDFTVNRANAVTALASHTTFVQTNQDKEQYREQRDNLIASVKDHLRAIGNFVIGLYVKNPHKAGDWGITIDESPKGSKVRTVTLLLTQHKVINRVLIESIMQNIGETNLLIYPGAPLNPNEATGLPVPVTLNAGANALVKRGFGTLTVKNTSDTTKGSISLVISK